MTMQNYTLNNSQKTFMTYVRTKMFLQKRFRNTPETHPVYINQSEMERLFAPFTGKQIEKELKSLVDMGELHVTKQQQGKKEFNICTALKPGPINLSVLPPTPVLKDVLMQGMKRHLLLISLPSSAPSSDYFNIFLKYKAEYLDLFFKVDDFSGRVHTPVTSFKSEYRKNLMIEGSPTSSIDVCTMQPLLLGKILKRQIGDNEFSKWIDSGEDIYEKLQTNAGLLTRDLAKQRFFEILFAPANENLADAFGYSDWIRWVNQYKSSPEPRNPHFKSKPHSNLAWLLQSTEVNVMRKVWQGLANKDIPFLSVHDEVIIKESDHHLAESIFNNVFDQEFQYYKINTKMQEAITGSYLIGSCPLQQDVFNSHSDWEYG